MITKSVSWSGKFMVKHDGPLIVNNGRPLSIMVDNDIMVKLFSGMEIGKARDTEAMYMNYNYRKSGNDVTTVTVASLFIL